MFGYIIPTEDISDDDYKIYHSYYCGLCHTLEKESQFLRMYLNNDMTFLIVLLSSLYETHDSISKRKCLLHPLKSHTTRINEITQYGCDMTILLSYYKLLDDVKDENKHKKQLSKMEKYYLSIKEKYPEKVDKLESILKQLDDNEKHDKDLANMIHLFSLFMQEIYNYQDDFYNDDLKSLGYNLGSFIVLYDAYDDYEEDIKKGLFNPLQTHPFDDFEKDIKDLLTFYISEATLAYERLPILINNSLIDNILYKGVWMKYQTILKKKGIPYESL